MPFFFFNRKNRNPRATSSYARWCDQTTRQTRMDEMREYAKEITRHVKKGANILEVAPGPGYVSIELAKKGKYTVTGIDISPNFVEIAKNNAIREKAKVTFLEGDVAAMPFEENTFDFIFCSSAVKHFNEPVISLQEMYRVLKPGGIAFIIDTRGGMPKQELEEEVRKIFKPGFESFWVKRSFKKLSKYAYTKEEFIEMINQTAFIKNEVEENVFVFLIYLYK